MSAALIGLLVFLGIFAAPMVLMVLAIAWDSIQAMRKAKR